MIAKSAAMYVISNYNTVPSELVARACNYLIYDQSDDAVIAATVEREFSNVIRVPNPGHSLRNFFHYIADNYEDLPHAVALLKGNIIGRHVTLEYFDRVYRNNAYTLLYADPEFRARPHVSSVPYESALLEINNSWYMHQRPFRYLSSFNDALDFLFADPVRPEWVMFAPGGCYIVPRENLLKYPAGFYRGLAFLTSYDYFPAEAYLVERLMHTVFSSNYALRPHCLGEDDFIHALTQHGGSIRRQLGKYRLRRAAYAIESAANLYRSGFVPGA